MHAVERLVIVVTNEAASLRWYANHSYGSLSTRWCTCAAQFFDLSMIILLVVLISKYVKFSDYLIRGSPILSCQ